MKHEDKQYSEIPILANELKGNKDPYPKIIEIHPTDACNYGCEFCFRKQIGGQNPILSTGDYAALFIEMKSLGINSISISGGGEPFVTRGGYEALALANSNKLDSRVVTNGSCLNDKIMLELTKAKEVRFSINAGTADTYAKIMVVHKSYFEKVLSNISNLISVRDATDSKLKVGVTFLIQPLNYTEVVDFVRLAEALHVDSIVIKQDVYKERAIDESELERINGELSRLKVSGLEIRDRMEYDFKGMRCFVPYFKIALNPSGDVFSCCLGSQPGEENGYKLGNLKSDGSLANIWKSSHGVRQGLMTNGVKCKNCNYTDYRINNMMRSQNASISK